MTGGILLIVAGGLGIAQLVLSWTSVVFSVDLPADGGLTGWQVVRTARSGASVSDSWAIAFWSILGVGLAGLAMVLLGMAALAPIDHRPLGAAAAVFATAACAGAVFWVVRAERLTSHSLATVFADAGPGWYLFLIAGPVGLAAAAVVLRRV